MNGVGRISGTKIKLDISKARTQSVIITGSSGNGKTMAMKEIEAERAGTGQKVLALNYSGTHEDKLSDDPGYNAIDVKKDGIPIPLLEHFSSDYGGCEEDIDLCEAVADAFSQVRRLGYADRNLLEKACQNALELRATCEDDMKCLYDGLLQLKKSEADRLIEKYQDIFGRVKFHQKMDLWRTGKVTLLDLSGYPPSTQMILTQLVLSVLWRYHRIYGQKMNIGTTVALDEFQNLPLKNSVLEQILREGRKFNLSVLLATQSLYTFDTAQRVILQQCGTKLYFRPEETELRKTAKNLPGITATEGERILRGLKAGECLACGEFVIAGEIRLRTLKVIFWER